MKRIIQNTPLSLLSAATFMFLAFVMFLSPGLVRAAGTTINGLTIDSADDGEALVFAIDGYSRPDVKVLSDTGAIAVTFNGAVVADGFLIPNYEKTAVIEKITYKLGFSDDVREVTFIFHVDGSYALTDSSFRLEEKEGQIILVILDAPAIGEPMDLLAPSAKPAAVEKPSYLTEIVSIDIGIHPGGEKVTMTTTTPVVPIIREFTFPKRLAIEIEGGYLTDELVDRFLYEDVKGLIQKVDLFVSPMEERGLFQMIISASQMTSYDVKFTGEKTVEFLIFREPASSVPKIIDVQPTEPAIVQAAPVEETTPVLLTEVNEPEPVQVIEEPEEISQDVVEEINSEEPETAPVNVLENDKIEYEDIPLADEPEKQKIEPPAPIEASSSIGYSLGYGDADILIEEEAPLTDVGGIDDEIEYPDLPVDEEGTSWDFPEMEPSVDPKHISDAIVSLNFVNAEFIDVMMILAEQAGVNFVLDAYWNSAPTGHSRNRPVGGPGGSGYSGGGFQPGGGWNPPISGGGSVTLFLQEVPFDEAFDLLMKANNLDYKVFRATPDAEPLLFLSTRERLEGELGLGVIKSYQLHYIPPDAALDFLYRMDMLPSSSGFGFW